MIGGWFAQNVSWYGDVLFAGPFGRDWTAYRMAQYLGHVVGTGLCSVVLARLGRQRWMADRAAMVPETQRTALSTLTLAALPSDYAASGTSHRDVEVTKRQEAAPSSAALR
jgi:hypothetical protein